MDLFSRKHRLYRPSVDLVHEEVPMAVRRALLNFLASRLAPADHEAWVLMERAVFEAPQIRCDFEFQGKPGLAEISVRKVVSLCQWYSFLDICQLLAELFSSAYWKAHYSTLREDDLGCTANQILSDNSIGYELRDGRIERIGAPHIDEVIAEARKLLQHSAYSGPNAQFEKAISFLNQRPTPDTANCIKDSVGALEGLARVVTKKQKATLSTILEQEPCKSEIPPTLRAMMQKLYAFRGDAEGAAHGQTASGQVPPEEAELVLGASASCIIYIAKKLGNES